MTPSGAGGPLSPGIPLGVCGRPAVTFRSCVNIYRLYAMTLPVAKVISSNAPYNAVFALRVSGDDPPVVRSDILFMFPLMLVTVVSSIATILNHLPECEAVSEINSPPLRPTPLYSLVAIINKVFGSWIRML